LLVLTNRLSFDGHTISRTGLAAMLMRLVGRRSQTLAVDDVERVEVATLRTLRRGGKVRYRYRVEIAGRGLSFVLASGGHEFRQMVRVLLPQVSDHKLDARARELRDHLREVRAVRSEAAKLGIASTSVLEETSEPKGRWYRAALSVNQASGEDVERAVLRKSANNCGSQGLRQSAVPLKGLADFTAEPWLIYEYARLPKPVHSRCAYWRPVRHSGWRRCAARPMPFAGASWECFWSMGSGGPQNYFAGL
jgi:hypothetical protein